MDRKVSLQINLAPGDYLYARHILVHQLRALSGQVDEIVLTVDSKAGKGRFGLNWHLYKDQLNDLLEREIRPAFDVRIVFVDYSATAQLKVAQYFYGKNKMPERDHRGGPFYVYFFGLFTAAHDLVLHLDSDMFLGGGGQMWVREAASLFEQDPGCFVVSPLPGPPHPGDLLIGQAIERKIAPYMYELRGMSTRIFMMDRSKFKAHKLVLNKPGYRGQIKAIVEGHPNADLPEHMIARYMEKYGLKRIDLLGSGKGLWSLHPPYRSATFLNGLPRLIENIEAGILPAAQHGFYDIIDEVCDWTDAREKLKASRWWKRFFKG